MHFAFFFEEGGRRPDDARKNTQQKSSTPKCRAFLLLSYFLFKFIYDLIQPGAFAFVLGAVFAHLVSVA